MLFLTGQYFHAIDAKSRLTIPAKLREGIDPAEHGYGFIAVVGPDKVLNLYTPKTHREMAPDFTPRLQNRADVRNYRRLAFGLADKLEVDRLGRILIPEIIAGQCGLKKDVAIVGVQDHIEIWPRDRWEQFLAEQFDQHDELTERVMSMGDDTPPPTGDVT